MTDQQQQQNAARDTDDFLRYCCGDPDCPNDCEREQPPARTAAPIRYPHPAGWVLADDRGDGLHWLRCVECGKEWAEKDSGAFVKGARYCRV